MKFVFSICLLIITFTSYTTKADTYRVVIIETLDLPLVTSSTNAFINEVRLLAQDDVVQIERYNAQGSERKAKDIIEGLSREVPVDLIVSVATLATRAVFNSPSVEHIPKLFMTVADPIKEGVVDAFGTTSSANITGESHVLSARVKLDLFAGLLGSKKLSKPLNIGLLHSEYPSSANLVKSLVALNSDYPNVNLIPISTPYREGIDGVSQMGTEITNTLLGSQVQLDGYWLSTGPLIQADKLVSTLYAKTGLLPLFSESITSVKQGALLGVVSDSSSIGKSAAASAKRILSGEHASSIPVSRTQIYTVAVNVSSAIKLNMPIPSSYLKLAKNHVYQ
ncbi:ABC transporter substrate-binding protein [Alteromonas sp. A079]|uniref:ABC transporter substrate-binding protein n=1 Tax=Alteromonas sp. A079 TaxID=3410268 RepID=UPI003BA183FD